MSDEEFWGEEEEFHQEVANRIFGGIGNFQDFLVNGNAHYGNHHNDIRFNFGTKRLGSGYKKDHIFHLSDESIRKSASSRNVLGYTRIPSIDLFGERLSGMEIFLLAPGEETGYLLEGEEREGVSIRGSTVYPVKRNAHLEILVPLGSWGSTHADSFHPVNSLTQCNPDDEGLFYPGAVCGMNSNDFKELMGCKEDINSFNNLRKLRCRFPVGSSSEEPKEVFITRGYLPGGQRFGEESTIVNPKEARVYQLFGLMGINTFNSKNRNLMAMVSNLGKIPYATGSYQHTKGTNRSMGKRK